MKKFKIYLMTSIFIVCTVLPLTSCSSNNTVSTNSTSVKNESVKSDNKDSKEDNKQSSSSNLNGSNNTLNSDNNTSNNSNASSDSTSITETQNKLNNKIPYPVFDNIKNKDKVNKLILNYVEKINNLYSEDGESLDISYTTMFKSNKYISIYFSGEIKNSSSPYIPKFKSTLNINIEKSSVMRLSDISNINENFINVFSSGIESKFKSLNSEVPETYKKENLKSLLSQADNNETYISDVQSYFTDSEIVVILSVPHAIGDYMEIHISNTSIEKLY